ITPDVTERYARDSSGFYPEIRAGSLRAEFECSLGDTEMGIDLERACLHAERFGMDRRAGVLVDDERANAATRELIGEHQPGRTRAYDEHVSMRWDGHQKSHTNGVSDCNRVMRHSLSSNCSIP